MQVFAFTESQDFKALLDMECKELFGIRPVIHHALDDLKYVLTIFENIDYLIVDLPLDSKKCGVLDNILSYSGNKIHKVIIYGDEKPRNPLFKHFERAAISELFEELKLSSGKMDVAQGEWAALPVCTLIHFQSLPFDLFIKLSDKRYVKRIPAFEHVGADLLVTLEQKGLSHLYCERKYKRDFSMMLINNMINKVEKTYSSITLDMLAQEEVFETTKEIVQSLGITGRVIEVCEASVHKMHQDVMKKDDELSAFLHTLRNNQELNFQFKLIALTNYISTKLILDMEMPESTEQVEKIIYASYFCDMTLKDPGHLYHRKAADSEALTLEDQNEVNFHALKASEVVGIKGISKEVALIIRQHHGSFGGIGFPPEKSHLLLPLSKILIVSQDLAFAILTNIESPAIEVLKGFIHKNKAVGLDELLLVLETSLSLNSKVVA